jgi:hypothetical protein
MMLRRSVWLCAAALLTAAASARAGDLDKFLPDDTEMFVSVNIRQIVDSDFFKKNLGEAARAALKNSDEAQEILKDLGFDPFRDLDHVLFAAPAGTEQDRGLLIAHGRFDLDKFHAKAEKVAKDEPDCLQIHNISDGKGGKFPVYEVTANQQFPTVYVALADDSTLLASPGKDYVVDAMRKVGAKEPPALKNKDMQGLLERMNSKQSISLVVVGAALTEGAPDDVKAMFEKIDAIGGGVTIDADIKMEVAISAKNTDDAKQVVEDVKSYQNEGRLLLSALAFTKNAKVDALIEVLNSVKISVKEKTVLIKASVSAETIQDALKQDK